MTEISDRYRTTAATFTQRVDAVPQAAWDNPAPREGWVARDVVRHLTDWPVGLLFDAWQLARPVLPSVDDDPAAAWRAVDAAYQQALDDPAVAGRVEDMPHLGNQSFEEAFDRLVTSDVFLHTWDLARATGLDETLDADECRRLLEGMEPMDEVLRQSGHYGPRVVVPEDADVQTRLLAFIGRTP